MKIKDYATTILVMSLCTFGVYSMTSSCGNINPSTEGEAKAIVQNEPAEVMLVYRGLIADFDAANARVESALDGDNPVELHNAIQARQLAEAKLIAHEDERARARAGEAAAVTGSLIPGPGGMAAGALMMHLASALMTKEGRKKLRQVGRDLGKNQPGAPGTFNLTAALMTYLKAGVPAAPLEPVVQVEEAPKDAAP